jgi:hypothetical protein
VPLLIESFVRDQVARYLAEQISLQELHEWIAPRAWQAEETAVEHDIELLIAEVSDGSLTEEELRSELYEVVPMAWANAGSQPLVTLSSTPATTQRISFGPGHLAAAVRIG